MEGRRLVAAAAAIAVFVTAVFFFLLLRPKLDQIATTQDEVVAAQDEELTLMGELARLKGIQDEAPALRAKLARVANLLPSTPELPAFIRTLQDAATKEAIELISIAPSPPGTGEIEGVQVVTVSVLVEGSFHRTEAFLARLENLDRLVEVTSVAVAPRVETDPVTVTLSTTLSMQMYIVEGSS